MGFDFDHIVVGLGAHGSALAAHLAARGDRVLGLEQYDEAHSLGSSHGHSRIFRTAYFEHPDYVPLLRRAKELWLDLRRRQGRARPSEDALFNMCGALMIGQRSSAVISGCLESIREHGLDHEQLTPAEIMERYPVFSVDDDEVGIAEVDAGVLIPELCIRAHCAWARESGARLLFREKMTGWDTVAGAGGAEGISVSLASGARFTAAKAAFCVGGWAGGLYGPDIGLELRPERRTVHWFRPRGAARPPEDAFGGLPIYIWEVAAQNFYGFPWQRTGPAGIKVAMHSLPPDKVVALQQPEDLSPLVGGEEVELVRQVVAPKIPSLCGAHVQSSSCIYTMTCNSHFVVDWHPRAPRSLLLLSPCSGHGFKFASAMGEAAADLLQYGASRRGLSLSLFKLLRHRV